MAKPDIDLDYIAELAQLLQRTGLTEIEIGLGDMRVRVAKQVQSTIDVAAYAHQAGAPGTSPMPPAPVTEPMPDAMSPGVVTSPMVGTVYLSPEPGAAPFVSPGQEVQEGETLLIIEAMKVMNQIRAPRSGRVTRVFVQSATPVEYGEPLLIIE